jgi:hypothetical protein
MLSLALLFLPSHALFKPPCCNVLFFLCPSHCGFAILAALENNNNNHHRDQNRFIIASIFAYLGLDPQSPIMALPLVAYALQEKTRCYATLVYFTSVGAWYCTNIRNIGDKGKSKALSDKSNTRVDLLMSKFDFDDGGFGTGAKGKSDQANETGNNGKVIQQKW